MEGAVPLDVDTIPPCMCSGANDRFVVGSHKPEFSDAPRSSFTVRACDTERSLLS